MRRLLLVIALLLPLQVFGTTLTGSIKYPDGTGVTGRLFFTMVTQGGVSSAGSCGGPYVVVPATAIIFTLTGGSLPGGAAVVGNDCVEPANTYYVVSVRDQNNNLLFTENWQITGSSIDVGTIVPTAPGPGFSGAVLLSPPLNAAQVIAGTLQPDAANSRDLGTTGAGWRNIYASNNVQANAAFYLSTFRFANGNSGIMQIGDSTSNTWTGGFQFFPATATAQFGIDTHGVYWNTVSSTPACNLSGKGIIYFDGSNFQVCQGATGPTPLLSSFTASGSITPATDVTYSLGSPSKRWQNAFVGNYILLGTGTTDVSVSSPFYVVTGNNTGFAAAGASANASVLSMTVSNGTCACLNSGRTGSGTYLPMMFATNAAERMVLTTTSQLYLGNTTTDMSLGTTPFFTAIANGGGVAGLAAATAASNASTMSLAVVNGSYVSLNSGHTGAGTYLPINFETTGAERMRILANGRVGIGTQTPDQLFTVETDQNAATYLDVVNATNSTSAQAVFMAAADQSQAKAYLGVTSSTFTPANGIPALAAYLASDVSNTNGLYVQSRSGPITFEVNSTSVVGAFDTSNHFILGATSTEVTAGNWVVTVGSSSGFVATTASTNASVLSLAAVSGTYTAIGSNRTGSGTYLPLAFFTNATETMLIDTNTTNSVCVRVGSALHRLTLSGSNFVDGGTC